MDDFVILLDTKEECRIIKQKIEEFLDKNLKLSLNNKSRYFPNSAGIDFCGYRILILIDYLEKIVVFLDLERHNLITSPLPSNTIIQ